MQKFVELLTRPFKRITTDEEDFKRVRATIQHLVDGTLTGYELDENICGPLEGRAKALAGIALYVSELFPGIERDPKYGFTSEKGLQLLRLLLQLTEDA